MLEIFFAVTMTSSYEVNAENIDGPYIEKIAVKEKSPIPLGAHERGIKVFVWVVNEPEDIALMKRLGVDGIFTDFPGRARGL